MHGCVGDDAFGRERLASFAATGVSTAGIQVACGVHSGIAQITVDAEGENTIAVAPGANLRFSADAIRIATPPGGERWVSVFQNEIPTTVTEQLILRAREAGHIVLWNIAPTIETRPAGATLAALDFLVCNRNELLALTGAGHDSGAAVEDLARIPLGWGVANLIVTLGREGSVWARARPPRCGRPPSGSRRWIPSGRGTASAASLPPAWPRAASRVNPSHGRRPRPPSRRPAAARRPRCPRGRTSRAFSRGRGERGLARAAETRYDVPTREESRMKKKVLVLVLALVCLSAALAAAAPKVAVLDAVLSEKMDPNVAIGVTEKISEELVSSGRFTVLDRTTVGQSLKEIEFQMSGHGERRADQEGGGAAQLPAGRGLRRRGPGLAGRRHLLRHGEDDRHQDGRDHGPGLGRAGGQACRHPQDRPGGGKEARRRREGARGDHPGRACRGGAGRDAPRIGTGHAARAGRREEAALHARDVRLAALPRGRLESYLDIVYAEPPGRVVRLRHAWHAVRLEGSVRRPAFLTGMQEDDHGLRTPIPACSSRLDLQVGVGWGFAFGPNMQLALGVHGGYISAIEGSYFYPADGGVFDGTCLGAEAGLRLGPAQAPRR